MKALRAVWNLLVAVYFIGFFLSALIFNWQYAKNSGFIDWLFLGEVVPTAKAIIWPYYAFRGGLVGSPKLTDQHRLELAHFRNSIELRNQAIAIIDPPERSGPTWEVSSQDQQLASNLLHRSLAESQKVSDGALALLDRDLPKRYDSDFRQGLALFIKGLEQPDAEAAKEGQRRLNRFGNWYTGVVSSLPNGGV